MKFIYFIYINLLKNLTTFIGKGIRILKRFDEDISGVIQFLYIIIYLYYFYMYYKREYFFIIIIKY